MSRLNIYNSVLQIEKKRFDVFPPQEHQRHFLNINYEFKCCPQCQNHQRHIPFTGLYSILVMGRFVKKIENLTLSSQKYLCQLKLRKY